MDARRGKWARCVENNGVLVSPFIHPVEKEGRDYALENAGNIIRVCSHGFAEREYAQGKEFDYFAEGRVLLVSLKDGGSGKLDYGQAQILNRIAEQLAEALRCNRYKTFILR